MSDTKYLNHKRATREKSFHVEVDTVSRRHLMFFIKNELDYYNELINNVTMRLRAFPEEITSLREGYGKLWTAVAYSGKNFRELLKTKVSSWPKAISESVPTFIIKNDQVILDDRKVMLFDAISVKGDIHPTMRKNIASELLSAILPQADQLIQGQKNLQGQMRDPVHMLVPHYYPERRHIQLTRELVKLNYNKDKQQTEVTIPYTDKPLIVKDHNIVDEKWDIMLIRQQPNISVTVDSPWQIDLMITSHKYLLDITDQNIYSKKRRAA